MNGKDKYFSQVEQYSEDMLVEQHLLNLNSLESIGIKDDKVSSYDEEKISKFKNSIEIKDGKIHVDLPWYDDVIKKVPSNFNLAKVIAKNVFMKNLINEISEEYWRFLMNS